VSVLVASDPWGASPANDLLQVPFSAGPVVLSDNNVPRYNGRKLPLISQWMGQDGWQCIYSLPYVASVSNNGPLPLSGVGSSLDVALSGILKNPIRHHHTIVDGSECGGVCPDDLLSFLNAAVSLFDELYLCAEFVAGKKTAGSALFESITEQRKEDFRRGNFEWRALDWATVSQLVLQEQREPRFDLIVRIAQEFSDELTSIASNPRKILRRVRKKTNLSRVQQMDAACLAWLVRQPGRSAIEKAGAAQQIYSIVREEFFDTLENRVLKQFLKQCVRYTKDYLDRNSGRKETERFHLVKRFRSVCQILLKTPVFEKISTLHHIPQPNFVLQCDPSYSKLWNYYLQILHREKELEELWVWQHQLWADLIRVFLSSTVYELSRSGDLLASFQHNSMSCIRQKSSEGRRMFVSAWPRGVLYETAGARPVFLDCFSSQELHRSELPLDVQEVAAKSGASFFFYFTPVDRPIDQHLLLAVWTFHGPVEPQDRDAVQSQSQRAAQALKALKVSYSATPKMRGFILRSSFGEDDGGDIPAACVDGITVEGLRVPANPDVWRNDMLPLISQLIAECAIQASEGG